MRLTFDLLASVAGGVIDADERANMESIVAGFDAYGAEAGLNRPHRLAQYIAQLAHESGRFRYDRELWGPTAAQKRYEGRADLGNVRPGDGSKYRGHGPIQITGRANTTAFRDWCRAHVSGHVVPDFVESPELINTDPWEGVGPIWYWDVGNPESRSLNRYADVGNIEMITKRINGGLNGFADRLALYDRTALVMLGFELQTGVIADFQRRAGVPADDEPGPVTRAAMHKALVALVDDLPEAPPPLPQIAPAPAADDRIAPVIAKLESAIADLRAA